MEGDLNKAYVDGVYSGIAQGYRRAVLDIKYLIEDAIDGGSEINANGCLLLVEGMLK
jgi:hypothetical protein